MVVEEAVVWRRVVEVLVRVWVTGRRGSFAVAGGVVVGGVVVEGVVVGGVVVGGAVVGGVVVAGTDVVGDDAVADLVPVAVPGLAPDLAPDELRDDESALVDELGAGEGDVEARGLEAEVRGCLVEVALGATRWELGWAPAALDDAASSSWASCEISLPCLAISCSSKVISLASEEAVALADTALGRALGAGPAWPERITLVALLRSAATAATLWCEEARRASTRYFSAEESAISAFWYCGGPKGTMPRSRLAPTATPTRRVTTAATRSRARPLRRAARMATATARTSAAPVRGTGGGAKAARNLSASPASSPASPSP